MYPGIGVIRGQKMDVAQTMNGPHIFEAGKGVLLDARRAVFLPALRTLAVADLHLGYAWAQRRRGQLLPIAPPDDTLPRLRALCADWNPEVVVVLGDFVHAAADVEGIRAAVSDVLGGLPASVRWEIVLGNHDHRLPARLAEWGLQVPCHPSLDTGGFRFVHGDVLPPEPMPSAWTLSGHEHPALVLGDGGTTSLRVPAFLVGERRVILPPFSNWAAGSVVGRQPFLGEWARRSRFRAAVACLGPRLLPIPWERLPGVGAV